MLDSNSFPPSGNFIKGIELPEPTSFQALPKFSGFNRKQIQASGDLQTYYIHQSGMQPGLYVKFSDVKALINVHDQLWDSLEIELHKLNRLDTCKRLYEKLEIIYGWMHRLKYQSASVLTLSGNAEGSEKRFDAWMAISPYTEGIRFLIELAIKNCRLDGQVVGGARLDYLIGLSTRILLLDEDLDIIHDQIVPFEISISTDFSLSADMSPKGRTAIDNWIQTSKVHRTEADRDWVNMMVESMGPKIQPDAFAAFPEMIVLDRAMLEELNYGFFDWLNYVKGCMDYFTENEFLKAKSMGKLMTHLKDTVGLQPEKIELILKDHALSSATMEHITRNDMLPIVNYSRDSRLLRRPLLDISQGEIRVGIMGVETFNTGIRMFFDSLEHGTIKLSRIQESGPVKSAIGTLQAQIGAPLRDNITAKCKSMGFRAEKEWPLPKTDKNANKVGPVDVLVIDREKRRFVLIEAKNFGGLGITPKQMKDEREKFIDTRERFGGGFLKTLNDKEKVFLSNREWHLRQLGLIEAEDYEVESVIVVNHPMFWPLVWPKSLPILDDLEFYKRLHWGQHFLTDPISEYLSGKV